MQFSRSLVVLGLACAVGSAWSAVEGVDAAAVVYENPVWPEDSPDPTVWNGVFVDRQGRKMADGHATSILTSGKDDEFFGPGHNGEIFTSKSGRDYMFYHCHWKKLAKKPCGYCPRPMFLQEIFWDADGWPYFKNNGKPQKACEWK